MMELYIIGLFLGSAVLMVLMLTQQSISKKRSSNLEERIERVERRGDRIGEDLKRDFVVFYIPDHEEFECNKFKVAKVDRTQSSGRERFHVKTKNGIEVVCGVRLGTIESIMPHVLNQGFEVNYEPKKEEKVDLVKIDYTHK